MSRPAQTPAPGLTRPSLRGHLAIARIDHWFKNVFVLPGIVVAYAFGATLGFGPLLSRSLLGLLAIGIVASSNYVVNELCDAPFDRFHPTKRQRPVPAGQVNPTLGYLQWIVLGVLGTALGLAISASFAAVLAMLWIMGVAYNLRPLRTKDLAYLDVLSESVNNPLRLLAGWYIADPPAFPPGSLLVGYWMVGAYFMALKRLAEWREFGDPTRAAAYRRSFGHYDGDRLLVSVTFYASAAMLFFGAFAMRYQVSLILSFPWVALVMALYLRLALLPHSPVQTPERLYRDARLMAAVVACAAIMVFCLFLEAPWLARLTAPARVGP